ncbi:MAG: DUF1326 domain-containing protein [Planctomycetota bacterium]|nr:DUF1326 domain-containing protein [Planctomycetota bacterium]
MRQTACALVALLVVCSVSQAAKIRGEYLESRTCDVYTGPCFANAEMELAGKEALMAWKVEQGTWNNISLNGLGVAVVVTSQGTLGDDGVFGMKPGKTKAVILVDENASKPQRDALVAFAKDSAKGLAKNVTSVQSVPFELKNDHLSGNGIFKAGEIAKIETRGLRKGDCVCTNETVFYKPLTKIYDSSAAYSKTLSFTGEGLNNKFTNHELRSSFLGTFRK